MVFTTYDVKLNILSILISEFVLHPQTYFKAAGCKYKMHQR